MLGSLYWYFVTVDLFFNSLDGGGGNVNDRTMLLQDGCGRNLRCYTTTLNFLTIAGVILHVQCQGNVVFPSVLKKKNLNKNTQIGAATRCLHLVLKM